MFNLSDDDSFSTQLEGKKLKGRGARLENSYKNSPLLEIEEDSPGLMEEAGPEEGQEYFTDRDLGEEGKEEREERLKKEIAAARRSQLELQKQQGRKQKIEQGIDDPNLKLDEIEQGVMQSQNKGEKTIETQFKQQGQEETARASKDAGKDSDLRKTDVVAVSALLGADNVKNLDLGDDKKLAQKAESKSIPAQMLPDVRGKEAGLQV